MPLEPTGNKLFTIDWSLFCVSMLLSHLIRTMYTHNNLYRDSSATRDKRESLFCKMLVGIPVAIVWTSLNINLLSKLINSSREIYASCLEKIAFVKRKEDR